MIETKQQQLAAIVNLYQALGGGQYAGMTQMTVRDDVRGEDGNEFIVPEEEVVPPEPVRIPAPEP